MSIYQFELDLRKYQPTMEELLEQAEPVHWGEGKLNPFYGMKHSEETKAKIKEARQRQVFTAETRKKMSEAQKKRPITWDLKNATPEANAKRSKALKGRKPEEHTCPHCGKVGKSSAMFRWHFDNCKEKK